MSFNSCREELLPSPDESSSETLLQFRHSKRRLGTGPALANITAIGELGLVLAGADVPRHGTRPYSLFLDIDCFVVDDARRIDVDRV
jgi:hypothetical protein